MNKTLKFGRYDGNAVRYTSEQPFEAWWYVDDKGWIELNHADATNNAKVMTEAEFTNTFPNLPALPAASFKH